MKVLVATREPAERERLRGVLAERFTVATDERASIGEALSEHAPTLAIVDPSSVPDVVRRSPRIQALALVSEVPSAEELSAAIDAGADDILRAGAYREEILCRVATLSRARARTTCPQALTMRIGRVRVWKDIERIVASELGELLGMPLHPEKGETRPLIHTSVIPLTLVSDHLLVQLGLGVDERTRDQLVELLLGGDSSREAVSDALRELANTAGGAIRRAALDDGVSFSIGLPSNENLFSDDSGKRRIWTITNDAGLRLDCMVALSTNEAIGVPANQLREGMVVSADVVTPAGDVLVTAGASLTETTVARIVATLGATSEVSINLAHRVES